MALKLADALGTSPELWIGMQTQYDLWRASRHRRKKVTRLFVGAGRHNTAAESRSSQSAR
jgi:antitoxin HigA-1